MSHFLSGWVWIADCSWWMERTAFHQRGQPTWSSGGEQLCYPLPQIQRSLPERMLAAGGESFRGCCKSIRNNHNSVVWNMVISNMEYIEPFRTSKLLWTWLKAAWLLVPLRKHLTLMLSSEPEISSNCWPAVSHFNRWLSFHPHLLVPAEDDAHTNNSISCVRDVKCSHFFCFFFFFSVRRYGYYRMTLHVTSSKLEHWWGTRSGLSREGRDWLAPKAQP